MVVVLGDAGGAEGVGLDQVGAGRQVALVDFLDHLRLGQGQQFVVALDEQLARAAAGRGGEIGEAAVRAAAVGRFVQFVLLDDGAHRAVEDHDAARQDFAQQGFDRGRRRRWRWSCVDFLMADGTSGTGRGGLKLYGHVAGLSLYASGCHGSRRRRAYRRFVSFCFKWRLLHRRYKYHLLSNLRDTYSDDRICHRMRNIMMTIRARTE